MNNYIEIHKLYNINFIPIHVLATFDIELIKILHEIYKYDLEMYAEDILKESAINGNLNMMKWLHSKIILTKELLHHNNAKVFKLAAENGHLKILKWIKNKFNITLNRVYSNYGILFKKVARNGNLPILKWLNRNYRFKSYRFYSTDTMYKLIYEIIYNNDFDMLKWILNKFVGDEIYYYSEMYEIAVINENIPIMKFLHELTSTKDDIGNFGRYVASISIAIKSGNLHILNILHNMLNFDENNYIGELIHLSIKYNNLSVLKWTHKKFRISKSDITNKDIRNLRILKWIDTL